MLPLLHLIYWFLPAYAANAAPPLLAKLFPKWNLPVDLGRKWKGRRLLGRNKTWRGVIGGTLIAGLIFLVQRSLSSSIITPDLPYDLMPWSYGILMGFGAIFLGDLGESLLKRRVGVKPGKPWIPWDQLDYTIGALIMVGWYWWPGWSEALFLLIFNGLISAGSHHLGYRLGVNKDPV